MSSFQGKWLPEFSDDKQFEKFALDLWASQHPDSNSTLYGRNGQAQFGVDVAVRSGDRLIGVQCKAVKRLDEKIIDAEVDRARMFEPALTDLVLVTAAPYDANLVSYTEKLTRRHKTSNLFSVSYHGWEDLLRILENHPWVVHKHFPEFFRSPEEKSVAAGPTFRLPLDRDCNITVSDEELADLCSEASWGLKNDPSTAFVIDHADEQRALAMIAAIETTGKLDAETRKQRRELRSFLTHLSPKTRRAEVAAKLLLTDDAAQSPWLIGGCWPARATTMRRLMPQIMKGSNRISGGISLKIRADAHPKLVGFIDMDAEDRSTFEAHCPDFNPNYFVGNVSDLGYDLGLKYALPAGIAALVSYSTGHDVPMESLRRDGTNGIYLWRLYPS